MSQQNQVVIKTDQSNLDDYERGDIQLARLYKEDNMVLHLDEEGNKVKYPLSTKIDSLGNVGVGIQLYFKFLSYFTIVFFIASLISIPQLYYNFAGNSIEELSFTSLQLKFSLSNQAQLQMYYPSNTSWSYWSDSANQADKDLTIKENNARKESYVSSQKDIFKVYYITEVVLIIFMILAIEYFNVISNKIVEQNDCNTAKMSDYSFKFWNFPETINDGKDIEDHFTQFGQVVEAGVARKYYGCLNNFKNEASVNKKILAEKKRLELNPKRKDHKLRILEKQKQKLNQKAQKKLKGELQGLGHDDYPSLWGYVVFNDATVRDKVYKDYQHCNRWSLKRIFCSCMWDLKKETPENYQMKGQYPLKVNRIDQPGNILWENQDVSLGHRYLNKAISYFLTFILLLITLIIIAALSNLNETESKCTINYAVLESQGTFIPSSSSNTQSEMKCYCRQAQKINYWQLADSDPCKESARQVMVQNAISFAVTFVILFTNYLLKLLMVKLSKFERYLTVTEETLNTIIKIFVAQFINTAIVPLLLNSKIQGFNISSFIYNLNPALKDYLYDNSAHSVDDLNRQWYLKVGQKISFTTIIMILNPHITQAITGPLLNGLKSYTAKSKFLQIDMNNAILPQPFDLTLKYAQILTAVFVCIFYSTGMPFMYIIICLIFLSNYYFQKLILLRVSSKPIKYSQILNENVLRMLPMAVIMKAAFAVWTLTCPDIFPIDGTKVTLVESEKNGKLVLAWSFDMSQEYLNRMLSYFIGTAVLIIVAGSYCSRIYAEKILKILYKLCLYICKCLINKGQNKVTDSNQQNHNFGSFMDEYQKIRSGGLITYEIRANKNYKDLVYALDFQEGDIEKFKQRQARHSSHKKPHLTEEDLKEEDM